MPIFKFLFSFRGRTRRAERPAGAKPKRAVKQAKSAMAMSAAIQMRAPAAQESESTSRSVLP